MTTRRNIGATGLSLAAALASGRVLAQAAPEDASKADYLFVQTARSMTYDAATGQLMLDGVSPITVFFSDRPERIAGNMLTTRFLGLWGDGKDSFLYDPPNADVSIVDGETLKQFVAELRDPALQGDRFSYSVKILGGEPPVKGADVSVFIDIFGMPRTPVSMAGFARRGYRRAWYR
jgi:hypothetical protein